MPGIGGVFVAAGGMKLPGLAVVACLAVGGVSLGYTEISAVSVPHSAFRSAPLSTVTIHLSDLRSGYTVQQQRNLSRAERAGALGVRAGQLRMHGWLAAYDAYYRRGSPEVESVADRYTSPAGAHWGYLAYLHSFDSLGLYGNHPYSRQLSLPGVGNESVAYGPAPTNVGGWSGILFRRGKDVFNVAVANTGHDAYSALALAYVVDRRIRAHG